VRAAPTGRRESHGVTLPDQQGVADRAQSAEIGDNDKRLEASPTSATKHDRDGMRSCSNCGRERLRIPHVVLNNLFKLTPMRSNFRRPTCGAGQQRPILLNPARQLQVSSPFPGRNDRNGARYCYARRGTRPHLLGTVAGHFDQLDPIIALVRCRGRCQRTHCASGINCRIAMGSVKSSPTHPADARLRRLTALESRQDPPRERYRDILIRPELPRDILGRRERVLGLIGV